MNVRAKRLVPIAFVVAGILFLVAALLRPAMRGQLLPVGALCLILGIATSRKSRNDSSPPIS